MYLKKIGILLSGLFLTLAVIGQGARAQTSSPFEPPAEKLGLYVVNEGSGLDTGCTFRGGGPLVIQLNVPATMNPEELNDDGTLKDPNKLISNKVIGAVAKISFPIYDIDDKADTTGGGFAPEVDEIYFNGELIKTLSGINNTWVNDSFVVDIGKVKFNKPNEIRIDIDTANVGNGEYWCMAVDWVAIEFDAAYPFVLAHGIGAHKDTWDEDKAPGVLQAMDNSGVLYERFSTPNPNGSVEDNAKFLKTKIKDFLDRVKADKVNIIAHSKGGLDAQFLAKLSPPDFEVLSLSTMSTPHRGSVVADLQLLQRQSVNIYVNNGQDPNGFAQQYVTKGLAGFANRHGVGPQPPGLEDLTTQAARDAINARIRGNVPNTFTIGADAGPQCSRQPTDEEIAPMVDDAPFGTKWYAENAMRLAYQAICNFVSAVDLGTKTDVYYTPQGPIVITTLTYSTVTSATQQPNDIVVGIRSANPGWGTSLGNNNNTNHSEIKTGANVQQLLDRTIRLR